MYFFNNNFSHFSGLCQLLGMFNTSKEIYWLILYPDISYYAHRIIERVKSDEEKYEEKKKNRIIYIFFWWFCKNLKNLFSLMVLSEKFISHHFWFIFGIKWLDPLKSFSEHFVQLNLYSRAVCADQPHWTRILTDSLTDWWTDSLTHR